MSEHEYRSARRWLFLEQVIIAACGTFACAFILAYVVM